MSYIQLENDGAGYTFLLRFECLLGLVDYVCGSLGSRGGRAYLEPPPPFWEQPCLEAEATLTDLV